MTLPEVLEFAKGRVRLSIDLKTEEIIPAIVRCIQEADMIDEVMLCGCYVSTARKVWACDDRLTIVLNMDSEMGELSKQADKSEFNRAYIRQAAYNHLSALNVNYKYVTPELIRLAHLRSVPVWTWTVDDADDMRRLIQLGVDAIYTNNPKRLLGVLDE
ncbi:glycerophosphodiester phosphodiesterase [Candidatus Poribacteria bacterium]|nr:glycerophosphodiester phosphodiesterase [Candidatus Poribacteria bacterium]